MYWDDKYGTHSVAPDVSQFSQLKFASVDWSLQRLCLVFYILGVFMQVISTMRIMMTEDSNNAVSNSFLLDDDSR